MLKRLSLSLLVLLPLLMPLSLAFGHAVITKNSLKIDPIRAGVASQISLVFNAKVEVGLSVFYLVKAGDIHEPLSVQRGSKKGEVLVNIPPLLAGEHAINFKIFAADGHLTEEVIRFFVVK